MKIYEQKNSENQIFAFEIGNTLVRRKRVVAILRDIPSVTIIKEPKFLSFLRDEDAFCEFRVNDVTFVVWEPWNDCDRFWIGPEDANYHSEIELIMSAFKNT